ncbi:MAG: hypothetical protein IKZ64_00290 [Alphaproteobacteria bacterium]|nr:hypothetical protein [Alphaproteobacteria bacterium]
MTERTRLPNGRYVYGNVEQVYLRDQKKQFQDVERISMVRDICTLPSSANSELAEKYDMGPHQKVGMYIQELTEAIKKGTNKLTPAQARQIMLITLAGVLYGVYEFDKSTRSTNKNALDARVFLLEDVLKFKEWIGHTLSELEIDARWNWERMNSMDVMGYTYVTDYGADPAKTDSLQRFGADLSKYYKDRQGKESEKFFKDFGRMLCRHVTHGYDARKSILDIRYSGNKVYDITSLIQAVKNIGDEYVLTPAVNLYIDAIIGQLYDDYAMHYGRFVYPRGKSSH